MNSVISQDTPCRGGRGDIPNHDSRSTHHLGGMDQRSALQFLGQHGAIRVDRVLRRTINQHLDAQLIAILDNRPDRPGTRQVLDTIHRRANTGGFIRTAESLKYLL